MSLPKEKVCLSVAQYLAGERHSDVRHEYVSGHAYPRDKTNERAGVSVCHNRIAGNIFARLNAHLDGAECEPFISDMKIRVAKDLFYYPDVVVTCGGPGGDPHFRTEPRLIIEVLSPTTERTDRHEKLAAYRNCPSVQEYALISQETQMVELHRRSGDDWQIEILTNADEPCAFNSIGLTLSLCDIYRNVRFDDEAEA